YEFGNKVSIIRSIEGVIIGALSFRNEHDVRTLDPALEQVSRLTNRRIKILAADRGYRGQKRHGEIMIEIPSVPKANDSRYERNKKKKLFCKRAGIEPTIGHLKSDHRLGRNFYKGLQGDAINVMLAAAAYNFKRAMRALWLLFEKWILELIKTADVKIENSYRLEFGF
ncbi:MAG: transposase, partial [Mucinivorans sp.]